MIREATLSDLDGLVALGDHFYSSMQGGRFSEKAFRPSMRMLIKSPSSIVLVAEHEGKIVGCLIGVIERLWYSEDKIAHDLAFGVKPEVSGMYARMMIREFVKWAKSHKDVADITMQVSSGIGDPDRIGRLYEASGLKKMGGCYSLFVGNGRRQ